MEKVRHNEVVVRSENSAEGLIQQAVAAGASVETMERLFALRKEVKAEQAKEAFHSALMQFQLDCPVIKKTKKVLNKDGRTVRYQFAPLDSITAQIRKPISNNSFSYSWDTKHTTDHMEVTCKLTHVLGHFDTSTMEIPIDKEGYMTAPQKYASAVTFAKRQTLLNVVGITTADEDTDATDYGKEKDAMSPKAKIVFLLKSLKADVTTKESIAAAVKKIAQLDLVESNYEEIIGRLEAQVQENREL